MFKLVKFILQKFFVQKLILKIVVAGIFFFVVSCKSDPYLYDRPGFDKGNSPPKQYQQNPESPVTRVAPDYYYRQQGYPPQGYAAPAPAQQPYYYPPQQAAPAPYYPPQGAYVPPYQSTPGSRFYSNPYAIPPSAQYPNYDVDQYYVPPTSYYDRPESQSTVQYSSGSGPY
jgi:hypothetical protein